MIRWTIVINLDYVEFIIYIIIYNNIFFSLIRFCHNPAVIHNQEIQNWTGLKPCNFIYTFGGCSLDMGNFSLSFLTQMWSLRIHLQENLPTLCYFRNSVIQITRNCDVAHICFHCSCHLDFCNLNDSWQVVFVYCLIRHCMIRSCFLQCHLLY